MLADAQVLGCTFAVLCLDLDRFKEVNDLYGHGAGDQVLRMAADRMSGALGQDEFVGRVGGDEFVVLQSEGLQPDTAAALATKLIEAFGFLSRI
jgi:diguanylate cyclase (GGDEF)-like protein